MAALSENLPWLDVRPSSFVQAANEGANAGTAVARTTLEAQGQAQRAQTASQQLALEAQAQNQHAEQINAANQMAAQKLTQEEHMAQLEAKTRSEILQQNRMREDQKQLIDLSYKTAELGIQRDRLQQSQAVAEQRKAIADATSKESALAFSDEANFAKHIAGGGDPAVGASLFPRVTACKYKAISESVFKPSESNVGGRDIIHMSPGRYEMKKPPIIDEDVKVEQDKLKTKRHALVKNLETEKDDATRATLSKEIDALAEQEKALFKKKTPEATTGGGRYKEGERVRNKKDGRIYVIKGGVPVPIDQAEPVGP